MKVNAHIVIFHKEDGVFWCNSYENLPVGNVVKVYKLIFFPVKLLLMLSNFKHGNCDFKTINLVEQKNLKVKRCLEATLPIDAHQ
jgi:phospholipid-translocating ATPase